MRNNAKKNNLLKQGIVIGIMVLFVGASVVTGISGNTVQFPQIIEAKEDRSNIKNEMQYRTFLGYPLNGPWHKTFRGSSGWSWDESYSVQQTIDGGYIIAGKTNSYGAGGYDAWLIKTDADGNELWNKTFGGSGDDESYSVQQTSDGGYIISGTTNIYGAGGSDAWLIKTDADGNELWSKTFGGSEDDWGLFVNKTDDEGYIIIGTTYSYLSGTASCDIWLIKTDVQGNEVWNNTFTVYGKDECYGTSVQQTTDGGYILTAVDFQDLYPNPVGLMDVWMIKTYADGTEDWRKKFDNGNLEWGGSIQLITDGGYIITGMTEIFNEEEQKWSFDYWLIKTDADGNMIWDQTFGGGGWDESHSVQQTSDGGYIIVGAKATWDDAWDVWLVKTYANGEKNWSERFGRGKDDWGFQVQQTIDGGYIITGTTVKSWLGGNFDVWLIKTDDYGMEQWSRTFGEVEDEISPSLEIIKPENALYIRNIKIIPFFKPVIIGSIDIEVDAFDYQSGVDRVAFYIDDQCKENDTTAPYSWMWDERIFFGHKHTIKAIVYDRAGNSAQIDEFTVYKFF